MKRSLATFIVLLCVAVPGVVAQTANSDPAAAAVDADAKGTKVDTLPPGVPSVHPIEHKDIVYRQASGQDLKLDVYENPRAGGKLSPVVVYWHGGAWWKGERPASYGSFRALLGMGFSVVSVDYRLSDVASAPASVQDVRCSLAWVKKNEAEYHFDATRVVAYGTSAGGHLALMAGMLPQRNKVDAPECGDVPQVAAIMDYYGIPDVKGVITSGIPLSKSTARWIGNGTGMLALAAQMSPVNYLRAALPAVFIAHGDADPTVPYQQSLDLKQSLEALHVPVTMVTVPGGGHGEFPPEQTLRINTALQQFFVENHIIAATAK